MVFQQEFGGLEMRRMRLAAAICEWLLLLTFSAYTLTMEQDLKSIEFESIRFKAIYL